MKYCTRAAFFVLLFSYLSSSAQTLKEALATAKKDNKIVMLVVESEKCRQCNEVANLGLSSDIVKRTINANAVLLKVNKLPEELNDPYAVFYIPAEFFGVLYLDANDNVITIYHGSSSFYKPYLDNLEKAILEKGGGNEGLNSLINEYYKKGSFELSYKLVGKLMRAGLEPKQEIIDDLARRAPADSAASLSFLQFIERTAPEIGSQAHIYTTKNLDNYNMSWYRMSNPERISINNRAYQRSMRNAIAMKDISYMYRVAAARSSMFQSSGFQVMQRMNQETMLQYYKGVKDTNNYLMNASRFYDMFFMTISVDSIAKIDSIRRAQQIKLTDAAMKTATLTTSQTVSISSVASYYGNALNDGAWTVYTYTKAPQYINKALQWAKRGVEFTDVPEVMDTYARILYRINNRAAAIEWETKAIAANKMRKINADEYEKVLEAMKKGADRIDEY